jgi:hypothetical protein
MAVLLKKYCQNIYSFFFVSLLTQLCLGRLCHYLFTVVEYTNVKHFLIL